MENGGLTMENGGLSLQMDGFFLGKSNESGLFRSTPIYGNPQMPTFWYIDYTIIRKHKFMNHLCG